MLSRSIATSTIVASRSSGRLLPNVCCLRTTPSLWNKQGGTTPTRYFSDERTFSTAAPQTQAVPKEEKQGVQHGSNWRRDGSPPTNPLSNPSQGGNSNVNGGRNNNNYQGGRGNANGGEEQARTAVTEKRIQTEDPDLFARHW